MLNVGRRPKPVIRDGQVEDQAPAASGIAQMCVYFADRKKKFLLMRDWPGSGLKGRGADYNRAPARPGGARCYFPVLAAGACPAVSTRAGAIACACSKLQLCSHRRDVGASIWDHSTACSPAANTKSAAGVRRSERVGILSRAPALAVIFHGLRLISCARSLKCGLTRRTAPMVFELSRRIARHAKWDEKNARVSLHTRARMHTGRWRSSETK